MKSEALLPGGIVSLTGEAADRLLSCGNGDAALLYLCLLRQGLPAQSLRWDPPRLAAAHEALVKMGLAAGAVPAPAPAPVVEAPAEPPEYTAADIAKELEDKSSHFPALVNEVQRRLGKILSTTDLKTLYTIYDFLALPAEVIFLLTGYCVAETEEKYGAGHKPRMSELRREAFRWHRLGLDSADAAEDYLRRQSGLRTREKTILPLLGISGRTPVEGERKYIAAWVEMGFGDDAIRLAYERTVFKKQNLNWPYMNSILRAWDQKQLHTVAEILAKDSARAPAAAPANPAQVRQHQQDDIRWMQEFLAKQKSEQGGE
ncbi:MAG: DnaD domain protein [Pseudoflavonifractor sp.]